MGRIGQCVFENDMQNHMEHKNKGNLENLLDEIMRAKESVARSNDEKVTFFRTKLPESGHEAAWEKTSRREFFALRNAKGRGKFYYPLSEGTESFLNLERCLREALNENQKGGSEQAGLVWKMWLRLWGRSIEASWCLDNTANTERNSGLIGSYDYTRTHIAYLCRMRGWRKRHLQLLHIMKSKTSGRNVQNKVRWKSQRVGLSLNDGKSLHEAILALAG